MHALISPYKQDAVIKLIRSCSSEITAAYGTMVGFDDTPGFKFFVSCLVK